MKGGDGCLYKKSVKSFFKKCSTFVLPGMTKSEILNDLESKVEDVSEYFRQLPDDKLFSKPDEKWSPAEQLRHLVLSVNPVSLGMNLPKVALLIYGKPNRASRSYEEMVSAYQKKLSEGAKASFAFTPKSLTGAGKDKNTLLNKWNKAGNKLAAAISRWEDSALDRYYMPHPILGKLTVREMLHFSIYHIGHHLESVKKLTGVA